MSYGSVPFAKTSIAQSKPSFVLDLTGSGTWAIHTRVQAQNHLVSGSQQWDMGRPPLLSTPLCQLQPRRLVKRAWAASSGSRREAQVALGRRDRRPAYHVGCMSTHIASCNTSQVDFRGPPQNMVVGRGVSDCFSGSCPVLHRVRATTAMCLTQEAQLRISECVVTRRIVCFGGSRALRARGGVWVLLVTARDIVQLLMQLVRNSVV